MRRCRHRRHWRSTNDKSSRGFPLHARPLWDATSSHPRRNVSADPRRENSRFPNSKGGEVEFRNKTVIQKFSANESDSQAHLNNAPREPQAPHPRKRLRRLQVEFGRQPLQEFLTKWVLPEVWYLLAKTPPQSCPSGSRAHALGT